MAIAWQSDTARRSSGRRQDAIGRVEPQRLAADTAARGELADEQAVPRTRLSGSTRNFGAA